MAKEHERSLESLSHFRCSACDHWWSIGDAPHDKDRWFCPWCGHESKSKKVA